MLTLWKPYVQQTAEVGGGMALYAQSACARFTGKGNEGLVTDPRGGGGGGGGGDVG